MKKLLMISIVTLSLILVGCGAKKVDYVKVMEGYSKQYYEKYLTQVTGFDSHEISIELLKNANKVGGGEFNVKTLEECKDSSYILIYVKKDTNVITKYEDHMNCK